MSSITIIIPALNEERNIAAAVEGAWKAVKPHFPRFELLLIDDGSTDTTGQVMETLVGKIEGVRVVHNDRNKGFGFSYRRGIELATCDYIGLAPGDNEITSDSMREFFALVPLAEVAIPHFSNQYIRPRSRQKLNRLYTLIVNRLFGLDLEYFNGPAVVSRDLLRHYGIRTSGFAFMTDLLVRLIRSGHTFVEGRMELKPRDFGESKAFSPKNVVTIFSAIARLWLEITITQRRLYQNPVRRINPPRDSWAGNSPGCLYGMHRSASTEHPAI